MFVFHSFNILYSLKHPFTCVCTKQLKLVKYIKFFTIITYMCFDISYNGLKVPDFKKKEKTSIYIFKDQSNTR